MICTRNRGHILLKQQLFCPLVPAVRPFVPKELFLFGKEDIIKISYRQPIVRRSHESYL